MKKIISVLGCLVLLASCKKETSNYLSEQNSQENEIKKPTPPPPPNANPAIVYRRQHTVSNQLTVPAIYVMDANGANQTLVYKNHNGQGNNVVVQTPDFPSWSTTGHRLSFILNQADLYTLDFATVNGVPSGSNPVKIGDGVAGSGKYRKAAWRAGTHEIASVWQPTSGSTSIRLFSPWGTSFTTLYTSPADFRIGYPLPSAPDVGLTFNQDGSLLAFFERQVSTEIYFLRIYDMASNSIVKNIELSSDIWGITAADWANTPGSGIIGFTGEMNQCMLVTAYRRLYTIDVTAETPSAVMLRNDMDDFSWSPDDSQVAFSGFSSAVAAGGCNARFYNGAVRILTLSSNTVSFLQNGGFNPDWKK